MTRELVNTIGLFTSPVIAVVVTLLWQHIREKHDRVHSRKEQLFLALMAHRRSQPPSQAWVDALNLIDVVFDDSPTVLRLWHEYYDLLGSATYKDELNKRTHKHLELLSAMAAELGYKSLSQTDIDKFYSPVAHGNEAEMTWRLRAELLRVLQGAHNIVIPSQPGQQSSATSMPAPEPPQNALPQAPPNAGTPASGSSE